MSNQDLKKSGTGYREDYKQEVYHTIPEGDIGEFYSKAKDNVLRIALLSDGTLVINGLEDKKMEAIQTRENVIHIVNIK